MSFDTLSQAKKEKNAEEEESAERDHQLRLAVDQEAKVSNLVFFIVYATHSKLNSLTVR